MKYIILFLMFASSVMAGGSGAFGTGGGGATLDADSVSADMGRFDSLESYTGDTLYLNMGGYTKIDTGIFSTSLYDTTASAVLETIKSKADSTIFTKKIGGNVNADLDTVFNSYSHGTAASAVTSLDSVWKSGTFTSITGGAGDSLILNDSLHVNGDVTADAYYGDGSNLTGVSTSGGVEYDFIPAGSWGYSDTNFAVLELDSTTVGVMEVLQFDATVAETIRTRTRVKRGATGTDKVYFILSGYAATAKVDSTVFSIRHSCNNRAYNIDTLSVFHTNATQDSITQMIDSLTITELGWYDGGSIALDLIREADHNADSLQSDFNLDWFKTEQP